MERVYADLVFTRRQILKCKLSPLINKRPLPILRVLIRPECAGTEPVSGWQCPADDLHGAAKRQLAIKENDTNAGHLFPGVYFNPLERRRPISFDPRNRNAAHVRRRRRPDICSARM